MYSGSEDDYFVGVCTVDRNCFLTITSRAPNGQQLLDESLKLLAGA
jgi:hypothetical protein